MKLCAILTLTLACFGLEAATADTLSEPAFDRLLDAIAIVESNGNPHAVGDSGRAIGVYQIHKSYWRDGTRFLGVTWNYEHAKDPDKAREVVRAYLLHYGRDKSLLDKARIHNGGPRGYRKDATLNYARRIAEILGRSEEVS